MPHFEWRDEYVVGVAEFDEQHQVLIALVDGYVEAMAEGRAREIVTRTLEALLDYTATHFAAEEERMQSVGYPGAVAHKAEHARMIEQARALLQRAVATQAPTRDTLKFLQDWLGGHILRSDRAYGAYFRSKGMT